MTSTSAEVRFAAGGLAEVEAQLRLAESTYIYCFTYPDRAPILAIVDKHVKVSLTVPDPDRVTADDVTVARELAEAVARYVAELEQLAAPSTGESEPGAESAGQAA